MARRRPPNLACGIADAATGRAGMAGFAPHYQRFSMRMNHGEPVAELAACGRAGWQIENETFNGLKTDGYNLEHNFGHGKKTLASVLVTLNLPAFA